MLDGRGRQQPPWWRQPEMLLVVALVLTIVGASQPC